MEVCVAYHYKVITRLTLDQYNQTFEKLGEKISNLTSICNRQTRKTLCAKYQDILTHLYKEVTGQKEKMYLSLWKSLNGQIPGEDKVDQEDHEE